MINDEKTKRLKEIKELIKDFCKQHLNDELAGYTLKLCDKLGRKRPMVRLNGRQK